ncbi:MAG: FecR domain-containing protein, partial [Verrucomicrobiota bacterium]
MLFWILVPHISAHGARFGAELVERENEVVSQQQSRTWEQAAVGLKLQPRDKVRTGAKSRAVLAVTDRTTLRLDERTLAEIAVASINLNEGGIYYFSRERAPEIQITTPAANGFMRGTQVLMRVTAGGKTLCAVLEGEVEISNPHGRVLLRSGEQGEAEMGRAPRKTAMVEARNIIQWAIYYPGVLDVRELAMSESDRLAVSASLRAYGEGDLLGALEKYPKGYQASSPPACIYQAAVMLAVGRVDQARAALAGVPRNTPARQALEEMIDAVNFVERTTSQPPLTASGWMARSYYEQSRHRLEKALEAARRAATLAPEFGFAGVRVAELEFSFGHTAAAQRELNRSLPLSPRNGQAHALRGFLLSADNQVRAAREQFQSAMTLDGALANAWLGRGLCSIRQGRTFEGQRDLQIAATLEPNRSILHSYLGKSFSQIGDKKSANKDFSRAKELDLNDPSPWLYSA